MALFPVTESPKFSETMEQIETTDLAGPGTFNPKYQLLLDNDNFLAGRFKSMNEPVAIALKAAGWAGSAAPYTQTVQLEGISEDCNPFMVSMLADGASEATQKAYNKAFGIVAAGTGTTGNGTVTFKVYKKPEIDLTVGLKGVW